jgi:hypothetical protein
MAGNSISNNTNELHNELMYLGTNMCEILTNLNTVVDGLVKIAVRYENLAKDIQGITENEKAALQ